MTARALALALVALATGRDSPDALMQSMISRLAWDRVSWGTVAAVLELLAKDDPDLIARMEAEIEDFAKLGEDVAA